MSILSLFPLHKSRDFLSEDNSKNLLINIKIIEKLPIRNNNKYGMGVDIKIQTNGQCQGKLVELT